MSKAQVTYLSIDDLYILYKKHLQEIVAFTYKYVRNEDDAKDLTQDVFYKLCNDIKKRNIPKINARAYLYRIARNHCIDMIRKNKIETCPYENGVFSEVDIESEENKILDSIVIDDIYTYIEKNFSEMENTVFKLKLYHNFKLEEIAEITESSIATVSRIFNKVSGMIEEKFSEKVLEN